MTGKDNLGYEYKRVVMDESFHAELIISDVVNFYTRKLLTVHHES